MKPLLFIGLLIMAVTALLSCKKNSDINNSINWDQELKGTLWAGEFKYTDADYTGLQAFSIEFKADGTITWSDVGSTRPGGTWKVQADKVTLTFPNGDTL